MNKLEAKRHKENSVLSNVRKYKKIYRVLCDNKTPYIQQLRRLLRNSRSEMVFGRYKPMEKVLSKVFSPEDMNRIRGSNPYKKSDKIYLYLLSDLSQQEVESVIERVHFEDYETEGSAFSQDIVLPAGELLNEESVKLSNTLFKELQGLGLSAVVLNPKTNTLELPEETVLGRKGESITKENEKILRILGIKNKTFHAVITGKADVPQSE